MLARYPKLETVHIRSSTSSTVCPTLPRLCINSNSSGSSHSIEDESSVDWADRGCDSAPVVVEGRDREPGRFFALSDHNHFHHRTQNCQRSAEEEEEGEEDPVAGVQKAVVDSQRLQFQLHSLSLDSDSDEPLTTTVAPPTIGSRPAIMNVTPEEDFKRLCRCVQLLHSSGYYYEGLSWQQATLKLRKCRVGTFLVRESENANYLFTLSVQTKKGPTSVRIAYKGGKFRLDSDEDLVSRMPVFDTVTDLVEYYIMVSKESQSQKNMSCCWLDLAGECSAPVELYYPLYKHVHSLKHLCRLSVAKHLRKDTASAPFDWTLDHSRTLGLPVALKEYLKEYPHGH